MILHHLYTIKNFDCLKLYTIKEKKIFDKYINKEYFSSIHFSSIYDIKEIENKVTYWILLEWLKENKLINYNEVIFYTYNDMETIKKYNLDNLGRIDFIQDNEDLTKYKLILLYADSTPFIYNSESFKSKFCMNDIIIYIKGKKSKIYLFSNCTLFMNFMNNKYEYLIDNVDYCSNYYCNFNSFVKFIIKDNITIDKLIIEFNYYSNCIFSSFLKKDESSISFLDQTYILQYNKK